MAPPEIVVTGTAQLEAWRRHAMPPVEEVRPGVWSVPVPIPDSPLRYVLCYLLETPAGPALVDPGWSADLSWDALVTGLAHAGWRVQDVVGVLVSHAHPDHHGLAARVREASGCWVGMHRLDADTLRTLVDGSAAAARNGTWLALCGVPPDEHPALYVDSAWLRTVGDLVPDRFIEDGDDSFLPDHRVVARWTPGHTPGHLCFRLPADGLVLTGDHLLPRISSHVGSYRLADDDVVRTYVRSLDDLAEWAEGDEVLPGHEYRFRGVAARVAAVQAHHRLRAAEVLAAVRDLDRATVWEVAERISWSRSWAHTTGVRRRLAMSETLSHLRHLEVDGRLLVTPGLPARWSPVKG